MFKGVLALRQTKLDNYGIQSRHWKCKTIPNIIMLTCLGKVEGEWPIAKTIRGTIPITLPVLKQNLENDPSDHFR